MQQYIYLQKWCVIKILFTRFRNMLSSAHVLAMDAKNLLDVVDSLRKRYPDLFASHCHTSATAAGTTEQPSLSHQTVSRFQFETQSPQQPKAENQMRDMNGGDENYQVMTRQSYAASPSSSSNEIYSNQPTSPQPQCGIYDNDCVILSQQLSNTVLDDHQRTPPKPPVAAKPSNLQQKLKRGQLPLPKDMLPPTSPSDMHGLDEPLRIVEDDMVCDQADDMQLYSNTMTQPPQLPEPVSCSIVQESLKKLNIAASHIKG